MFKPIARKWLSRFGALAVFAFCALFLNHHLQTRHWLSFVPKELGVTHVLYTKVQSWGFGPGGNETGVVVYVLPDSISQKIQKNGISQILGLPVAERAHESGPGHSDSWQATPLKLEGLDENLNTIMSDQISHFLNRYGFGVEIDPQIEPQINRSISQSGSFAALGRNGVLIVSPALGRAFYVFNG